MQIKDKKAIVTGAASELGLTISRELLRNGASMIAMIDIRETGRNAMDTLNVEFGRNRATFFQCDVANNSEFDGNYEHNYNTRVASRLKVAQISEQFEKFGDRIDFNTPSSATDTFKKAVHALGGLDILVNSAGVINETDFSKAIDVNVTAVIRGTLLGIQKMQKDAGGKGGVIVNISSVAGLRSLSQLPVYSATKHAVVSFSRSFAQPYHYQRTGVKIIVMCPEFVENVNTENFSTDFGAEEELIQKYFRRVDSIAHGLVYVIRCAQNGSIWINEDGKPVYEIQLTDSLPQKLEDPIVEENEHKITK